MPVEIREVVVRAVINPNNDRTPKTDPQAYPEIMRESLVTACVNEVMRILKRAKER
jgi:hypothetical protein